MNNLWIVTFVNSISETSMPVNEFVIYRANKYNYKQTLISLEKNISKNVKIPDNVDVFTIGRDFSKLRKIVKKIENNAKKNNLKTVYHIHYPKIGLLFLIETLFFNIYKKTLFTVHSNFKGKDLKYKFLCFVTSLFSYKINCVSKTAYDDFSFLIKKIKSENLSYIRNGVDFSRILSVEKKTCKDNKKLVCIARIMPQKNQIFLINLLKKLPGYKLLFIGKIIDPKIVEYVKKENLQDRVEFTDLISREEVFEKASECYIYLSASLVEGLPISVLEAMGLGLIPILSDISPHIEIYEECDKVNVLPIDENIWCEKIKSICKIPQKEYDKIANEIIENVFIKFSLDKMHKEYEKLYSELF